MKLTHTLSVEYNSLKLKQIFYHDGRDGTKTRCCYVRWIHSAQWNIHHVSQYLHVFERKYENMKLPPAETKTSVLFSTVFITSPSYVVVVTYAVF